MLTILRLFGRSPFTGLQTHMESVSNCVHCLFDLYQALEMKDYQQMEFLADKVSRLEHDADLIKNDIRNSLSKNLVLPIAHDQLLQVLTIQDSIADKVEDVAVLFTLAPLELLPIFKEEFKLFLHKNIETFDRAKLIINELHELVESSFGGIEAEKVRVLVDGVAFHEHEADLIQRQLLKKLYKAENQLTYATFQLWQRIFENLAAISNLSENLAYRVRMTLELK